MPVRFQVDSDFYDHPKTIDLSDAATALWVRAGSYSAAKLTDGLVVDAMLARLSATPQESARELVRRGLWKRVRGGYRFHQWEERGNLTRERIEAERSADRQRKRRARQNGGYGTNEQVSTTHVRAESDRTSGGTPNGIRGLSVSVSKSVSESDPGRHDRPAENGYSNEFEEFWDIYPRRTGKKAAAKAYRSALKDTDADTLNAAAKAYASSMAGKDQKFIPHPTTWLNQGRWEDEPETQSPSAADDVPHYWRRPQP